MDMTVVRSGQIPVRERQTNMSGRTHLHLSFCFICCSFHPFCSWFLTPLPSTSLSVPPQLPALLPLSFPSMYIFRSRVIKSAPEGMCWNRISLILPCPHLATKTQIRTNTCTTITTHAQTNAPFFFFLSVYWSLSL